ncbi:MAG TPA: glycosyltransferase family 39 protein [Polyangiaceae bacterium]|nr:glycosyltransferase family 39 protein [Polyangiaceae bacterium]
MPSSDSTRPTFGMQARAFIASHPSQIALGLGVALLSLAVHFVELEPIEIGGDALNKWHFARQWFHHFDVRHVVWDHHLTRMGVNVPTAFVQLVLGRRAPIYHVASLAASTLVAALVYTVGVMAHGRAAGLLAAVWVVLFPAWVRAGSQLSPDSFGAAWAALALVFLLAYADDDRRRTSWLVLSALAAGGAYLAKEPLVFFIPGALVGVFVLRRSVRDVLVYAAVPIGVFALETLFYRAVSTYSSRFAIVSATHGKNQEHLRIDSVWDALGRFSNLPDYYYPLLVLALVGAVCLPFLTRDKRVWAVLAFPASFFFCYTFAFRHLKPLTLWTRFLARYLDAGVAFAALAGVLFVTIGVARLVRLAKPPPALLERVTRLGPFAGGALLLGVFAWVCVEHPLEATHPWHETARFERILTDAYRRGVPIVARGGGPNGYRALKAAYSVYIDDDALLVDGKLPRYAEAYASRERMVRPGAPEFPPGCVVKIWMHDRFLELDDRALRRAECR